MALLLGAMLAFCFVASGAETSGGIGLVIVYDTSGSMNQPVRDRSGNSTPKYQIANRALLAVVNRLEAFQKANPDKPLSTGLVIFSRDDGQEVVPFGTFQPDRLRAWVGSFSKPGGATPLGKAMRVAATPLLGSKLQHKHILVITDGENSTGPDPAAVTPGLRDQASKTGSTIGIHFVAFDVAASVFDAVKKLNATVVSAADEKQLDEQLSMILERKILLEDEEPASKKP